MRDEKPPYENSKNYKGVWLTSRENLKAEELRMRKFLEKIDEQGLLGEVKEVFWDSKSGGCFVTPKDPPRVQVERIGNQLLDGQFQWQD